MPIAPGAQRSRIEDMASIKCRECGRETDSNSRQTRCPGCGALFPFACAVCERPLRPPFPVYDDERYLTGEDEPLCQQHFQRQCPRCDNWFQADQNPGFFLCPACSAENAAEPAPATATTRKNSAAPRRVSSAQAEDSAPPQAPDPHQDLEEFLREEERGNPKLSGVVGTFLWIIIAILLLILGRQIFQFLTPLSG